MKSIIYMGKRAWTTRVIAGEQRCRLAGLGAVVSAPVMLRDYILVIAVQRQ